MQGCGQKWQAAQKNPRKLVLQGLVFSKDSHYTVNVTIHTVHIPVRARYIPKLPDILGRKYDPPTSGKNPMNVSGIAKSVCSDATLKDPCTDSPTPYITRFTDD